MHSASCTVDAEAKSGLPGALIMIFVLLRGLVLFGDLGLRSAGTAQTPHAWMSRTTRVLSSNVIKLLGAIRAGCQHVDEKMLLCVG